MGQAKRRGSFEVRQAEAEVRLKAEALADRKRLYEEEKALTPEEREKRKKLRSDVTRFLAIAAGII